jgi:hypothetical protein
LFGLWALAADVLWFDTVDSATARNFSGIAAWHRFDPVAASFVSDSFVGGAMKPSVDELKTARVWAQRAVDLEPDNAAWRANLALRDLQIGDNEAARQGAERALALHDENVLALQVLQVVAQRTDDDQLLEDVTGRLCRIDFTVCPGSTDGG